MAPADFHHLLRAKPFEPFRVVTTDGTTYEVRHPDLVMVGFPSVIIGYPHETEPHAYSRYDVVSMWDVVRLEPMPQPISEAQLESNGQQN